MQRRIYMAPMTITKNNFEAEVLKSEETVLIDFWAPWCGPCRMVSPVVDEVAKEVDSVKVGKVNVDEQPELAAKFQIMSIPTLIVMKNGRVASASVGVKSKKQILDMIESGSL
ncbi:MAG: thioredoxin [Clostridiales bacterium]|nr:thioredoxin [Clostridiales bacterium]